MGAKSAGAGGGGLGAAEFAGDPVEYLRGADPVLRGIIDEVGVDGLGDARAGRPQDHYGSLVRSIVGQQLPSPSTSYPASSSSSASTTCPTRR